MPSRCNVRWQNEAMQVMYSLLAALVAYLLGSLSFAVIVSRVMGLADPRTFGSKNPGATNVLRSGSKKAAIVTLLLQLQYLQAIGALLLIVIAYRLVRPSGEGHDAEGEGTRGECSHGLADGAERHFFSVRCASRCWRLRCIWS